MVDFKDSRRELDAPENSRGKKKGAGQGPFAGKSLNEDSAGLAVGKLSDCVFEVKRFAESWLSFAVADTNQCKTRCEGVRRARTQGDLRGVNLNQ
jgi:hypothetical protein